MSKIERQNRILEIIKNHPISRQEELIEILEAENFAVNQSRVSRDFVELGIVKIRGVYTAQSERHGEDVLSVVPIGENLIVVKCEAGLASAVCVKIDRQYFRDVAGTIAGDDTIFVAVKNSQAQKSIAKKIKELFGI